jgi:oxygen-independent coproporphyrinogen-3 oxidase
MKATFDAELISRYNVSGARYTSYPTANVFATVDGAEYRTALSEISPGKPISVYVHVPFCSTICYYCACNKINTGNHRHADAYVERLKVEMDLVSKVLGGDHPVEQLHFGGGTPTFLTDQQMQDVFAALNDNFDLSTQPQRDYSIEIDPRKLPVERISHLAVLGFNRMSIGIQDFDPAVQEAVNRIQSEAETRMIVDAARQNNFNSLNVDLIYGLPRQTRVGFQRTIGRVLALSPDRVSLYNYAHLPERFKTQRQIKEHELPAPDDKLKILGDAIRLFSEAGYEYLGMDHFAKPTDGLVQARENGTLHRNFQGYTTHGHCDLIALGVSAISKVGRTFAQNAKTLENYYAAIDAGEFATERGYVVSDADLIAGDAIQELMCGFHIDIPSFSARHNIDFWVYFRDQRGPLEEMVTNGLVELSDSSLRVTEIGRFLVRNICMVFDAHLSAASGFSRTI